MKNRKAVAVLAATFVMLFLWGCKVGPTSGAFLEVEPTMCLGCGKCVAVCKYDAITVIANKACPYDAIH